jgi:hypothetical protein
MNMLCISAPEAYLMVMTGYKIDVPGGGGWLEKL